MEEHPLAVEPATREPDPHEINALPVLTLLARRWRFLLALPLGSAAAAIAITFLLQSQYTAATTVLPEQRTGNPNLGSLAGIASQLGVGGSSGFQSPQFYGDLLGSREVLRRVLLATITPDSSADSSRVFEYLVAPGGEGTEARRFERAVRKLKKRTAVRVDTRTGVIGLEVTMPSATAASQVTTRFIEVLNDFNTQTRRSQASERRKFTERRLAETQDSLSVSEGRARHFLERNRQYRESPTLTFEFERLQRQVSVYEELYSTLRRQYESARIDEVNDTPVITVIDPPNRPASPSSPKRIRAGLVGFLLGALGAVAAVLFGSALDRARERDPAGIAALRQSFGSISRERDQVS